MASQIVQRKSPSLLPVSFQLPVGTHKTKNKHWPTRKNIVVGLRKGEGVNLLPFSHLRHFVFLEIGHTMFFFCLLLKVATDFLWPFSRRSK